MSILPSLVVVGGTVLDGAIQLVLERDKPWTPADAKVIDEIIADFVGAGAFAAYPAPKIDPGKQELEITGAAQVAAARMSLQLRAAHLDARAFQILRQMVSRPDSDDGELRHMMVVGSTPGVGTRIQYPPIDFENEADQYPDPPAKPGFHVVWDDEGSFSKSRRVLVEFPGVVEGKVVDELSAYVAAWGKLLDRGAFAMPLGLPDVIYSVMGPVVVFDAITFEIEIPVYNGSELGFEVLLHVLSTYHVRVAPIRVVTID